MDKPRRNAGKTLCLVTEPKWAVLAKQFKWSFLICFCCCSCLSGLGEMVTASQGINKQYQQTLPFFLTLYVGKLVTLQHWKCLGGNCYCSKARGCLVKKDTESLDPSVPEWTGTSGLLIADKDPGINAKTVHTCVTHIYLSMFTLAHIQCIFKPA